MTDERWQQIRRTVAATPHGPMWDEIVAEIERLRSAERDGQPETEKYLVRAG